MGPILGIVITLGMVFGSYLMAGGKLEIILHALPHELMAIGGAAVGAFIVSNDFSTIKHAGGDIMKALSGPKWKKKDYQDLLLDFYQVVNLIYMYSIYI